MNIQDMEKYDDFVKLKKLYNIEFKEKYNRIEKMIRNGNIQKEG